MTLHDRLRYVSNAVRSFKVLDEDGELDGISAFIGAMVIVFIIAVVGIVQ